MQPTVTAARPGKQWESGFELGGTLELPLMGRLDGPSIVHPDVVAQFDSYRDAVRYCFMHRRTSGMCRRLIAALAEMPPQHIGEYLSEDTTKREMPAKYIPAFESVCGNSAVSQWLALQANLTVMEELQARRAA